MFRAELLAGKGPVTIWVNSPGGDCIAASQIYAMLIDYKDKVTVKIDGIAASAASVISMAGSEVLIAPTAMMMIHNPVTTATGDHIDMQKAIEMLDEVKDSIITAYEIKTGLSHTQLAHMMDATTWMSAKKAIELGFADGMLKDEKAPVEEDEGFEFAAKTVEKALINKICAKMKTEEPQNASVPADPVPEKPKGRLVSDLMERLNLLKN